MRVDFRLNPDPASLRVGDKVQTDFHWGEEDVVRKLTTFEPSTRCSSGYMASADGGEPCPTCGREYGTPVPVADSAWFRPVPK